MAARAGAHRRRRPAARRGGPAMTSTAPSRSAVIRIDALLDAGHVTAQLRAAGGDHAGSLRSARLLDHKPGRRALVAYQGDGGEIYGKAYSDPASAARSFDILRQ